jgi:signal transduction histidine kinase
MEATMTRQVHRFQLPHEYDVILRVAHEVQQPLFAARAALELVRKSPNVAQRARASAVLERQLDRLTRLVEDLLDAGRLHVGQTRLRFTSLDLRQIVNEVAESFRPQAEAKRQHLATRVPPDPIWVEADDIRLQQIISNLLGNSIRYTDAGGRVSVVLLRTPRNAIVIVKDTGRGIDADFLPHIFEPYVRDETATEAGVGVGLAIARQLVHLHGGTINAFSDGSGTGSEFVVTLPIPSGHHLDAPALVRHLQKPEREGNEDDRDNHDNAGEGRFFGSDVTSWRSDRA